MQFYLILATVTFVIAALAVAITWKTRQIAFLLGVGFLYYWSIYGGWLVTNERTGKVGEYRFDYLFFKMLPIYLDEDYALSLLLYALFIIVIEVVVLLLALPPARKPPGGFHPVRLSHGKLLLLGFSCSLTSVFLIRDVIITAVSLNVSGYVLVSADTNGWASFSIPYYSIYQVLHHSALAAGTLGLAVLCGGENTRYIAGKRSIPMLAGYVALLTGLFTVNTIMGNRSTIFFAVVAAGLFYLGNTIRPNWTLLVFGGVLGAVALMLPGIMRHPASVLEMIRGNWSSRATQLVEEAGSQEVEAFAAHASMYGAVHKQVPLTYGSSFLWLAQSVIPRVLRSDVVPVIYYHYAIGIGAASNQGYTIHHATGWYLNFGTVGVVLGALVIGYIWAHLFNSFHRNQATRSHPGRVFGAIAFWTFTAYMPMLIRSGPEVYKAVAVEAILAPTLIVVISTLGMVMRNNRPCLVALS